MHEGLFDGWEEIGRCQRLEQVARLKLLEGGRDVQHEGIGGVQTESQNAIRRHYGAVIIRGVVRRSEIARNVLGTMSKMSIIRGSLYLRILKHFGIDTSSILLGHPFKFYSPSLIVPFRIDGQSWTGESKSFVLAGKNYIKIDKSEISYRLEKL